MDAYQPPESRKLHPMIRYARRYWLLAACLSGLAGFVDALGFLELGGFFVSFMSGNSTRLGVGLDDAPAAAWTAAALIGAFVLGVMLGSLAGHAVSKRRAPVVLALVTLLLALAGLSAMLQQVTLAVLIMAVAMGAENAVFERDGEVSIGLTYMTGALVRFAQRLTMALLGDPRFTWAPFLLLWCGLVLGATIGAGAYGAIGLGALWIAACAALLLTCAAALLDWRAPA